MTVLKAWPISSTTLAASYCCCRGQEQWEGIQRVLQDLGTLTRILTLEPVTNSGNDPRVRTVSDWLPDSGR